MLQTLLGIYQPQNDELTLLDASLDRLGRDVFPTRRHDDVFLAIRDHEETVLVEMTDVARVKPPVLDHFVGEVGAFEVALHDVVAAREYLAVFGDANVHAGNRFSNRPETKVLQCVNGDDRRCLAWGVF